MTLNLYPTPPGSNAGNYFSIAAIDAHEDLHISKFKTEADKAVKAHAKTIADEYFEKDPNLKLTKAEAKVKVDAKLAAEQTLIDNAFKNKLKDAWDSSKHDVVPDKEFTNAELKVTTPIIQHIQAEIKRLNQ